MSHSNGLFVKFCPINLQTHFLSLSLYEFEIFKMYSDFIHSFLSFDFLVRELLHCTQYVHVIVLYPINTSNYYALMQIIMSPNKSNPID